MAIIKLIKSFIEVIKTTTPIIAFILIVLILLFLALFMICTMILETGEEDDN